MSRSDDTSIEFQNATVCDGSGGPRFTANVTVTDGIIQRIGTDPGNGDRVIDLDGSVLAPGFIDMHAHSDLRLFEHPEATEKLTQGITTEVLGQDGVSVAPTPASLRSEWAERVQSLDGALDEEWPWTTTGEYLDRLGAATPAVNAAYYAPHGNLRSHVAGFEDRPLDDDELSQGEALLNVALDEGAFGLSTGMIYPPSSYGRDDELEALGAVLAERDSFMISHVWNETDRVIESIDRYLTLCDRAGCHAHISHLKVGGQQNWGAATKIIELIDCALENDQRVTFDQYPYTAGSTTLTALLPPWARQGETPEILERLRSTTTRERIAESINGDGDWENLARAAGSWENILITDTKSGQWQGTTIEAMAASMDREPVDALCELLLQEELDVTMADFIMDEGDIEQFIQDMRGTFCTDGIFGGKPHPRAIGTVGRLIDRYVTERETLSLEAFVAKAAGTPADILGLQDRGFVREGYVADLVVFDPDAVHTGATFEKPWQLTEGFEYVVVGGTIVLEDETPTGERTGTVLRSTTEWDGRSRPTLHRTNC
ncbi:N-acyl-D-amino-acid deacylase family protein [Halocatena halophila]|uniref:N-acyl-D-amino-acid deacylase family protein n=1 Tax=Halocatena halophila TaxID=2814576 RepID=UPI002ED1C049